MENSPLSKIPPELRNQIYELVLTYPDSIKCIVEESRLGGSGTTCKAYFRLRHPLGMIETCKAIHNESSQLVSSCNTIEICRGYAVGSRFLNDLHLYVSAVSSAIGRKNARLVKAVMFDTEIAFMDGGLVADSELDFKDELLQLRRAVKLSSLFFPQSKMSACLHVEACIAAPEGDDIWTVSKYLRRLFLDHTADSLNTLAVELEQAATGKRLESEQGTISHLVTEEARDIAAILRRTGMRLDSHKLEFSGAMEEELRT
ncbi:hypothetical protein LTR97_007887 [Elasticomyces elasticus]|uniref:Uncharacterized protein n=1 Tax=Elasticomyces elasticus TaxID=574655 RepID=A0AAN7W420_9PEZI|nr:hypothetical protein LTR97_007887 [Elasticomyces elasticus]